MPFSIRKLIFTMLHQIVFIKPNLHQAVITAPAIRMNHGAGFHMAADRSLAAWLWSSPARSRFSPYLDASRAGTKSFCHKSHDRTCHEPDGHRSTILRLLPHLAAEIPFRKNHQSVPESSAKYYSPIGSKSQSIRRYWWQ